MNNKIFVTAAFIALLLMAGFRYAREKQQPLVLRETVLKRQQIIQCSPDWSQINEDSLANNIGVLPGWGNYRWHITAKNDSAQFYFNQGISMYYAFHIMEAMASFKKAQLFDAGNAMIYWAQALAYGPNINDFAYAATPEAFAAAQKALSLKNNCTEKEKALIEAIAVRYSSDSTISRASLNQLYADALKKSYSRLKQDADIATLYADALMLQHPWDYWKHNGTAEPWTPQILSVLESILSKYPNHPGANHYYIHMIEASSNPQRALASANRLGILMPGVAHMVHMPSHIYIRSGNYTEGIKVNEMSVQGYNKYLTLYPAVQNNAPLYLIHNLHMQTACAMMKGNYSYSNKSAVACSLSFDTSFLSMPAPLGNFIQYVYMTPAINNVRFGKWDEILNAAPVKEQHLFATVLWHWARGMAFAGKNNTAAAANELMLMQQKMKAPDMQVVMEPFNSPFAAAKVAEKILAAAIAVHENDFTKAIELLNEAVVNEDALIYDEPKDWLLPARQYLGAALLQAGNAVKAAQVFKEDLKDNPNNHWALYGLYQSLIKQKKNTAAIAVKKQFDTAFAGSDIPAGHIVF
jgi:tetratricopeptide (TPR) repeat protein